jgi:hypothetical protein
VFKCFLLMQCTGLAATSQALNEAHDDEEHGSKQGHTPCTAVGQYTPLVALLPAIELY